MVERFRRMMMGRYGGDQLGVFLIIVYFVLSVLTFFVPSVIIVVASYAVFALWIYRFLSKKITRRHEENQAFLKLAAPFIAAKNLWKRRFREKDTSRIYRCPQCKQSIRVPRGKGKIAITCPKCRAEFIKRT